MLKRLANLTYHQTDTKLNVLEEKDLKWIDEEVEQAMEGIKKALEYLEKASMEDAHIYFGFVTNNVREALESVRNIFETSTDVSKNPGMRPITPETSTDVSNANITTKTSNVTTTL